LTKADNISLYQTLNSKELNSLPGAKFAYAISKNLSILKPEIEALQEALKSSEVYKKFDDARIELAKSLAKKDEKGEAIIITNEDKTTHYDVDEKEFNKAFESLKLEHKEAVEEREKQIAEQNELLKAESNLVLYKVALNDIPNAITGEQMRAISEIVSEEIPSPYKG